MTIRLSDSSDVQGDYKFDIKNPPDFQDPSMDISSFSGNADISFIVF